MDSIDREFKLKLILEAIEDKKGKDVKVLDLTKFNTIFDCFVICSVDLPLHGRAVADEIDFKLSKEGIYPLHIEGYENSDWILMDYGDIVVHIFTQEARRFYDLDRFWEDVS